MFLQAEPKGWIWIERLGSLASLGIIPLIVYLLKRIQRLRQGRRIEAKLLPLNSGFTGLICCVSAPHKGDPEVEAEQIAKLVEDLEFFEADELSQKLRATRIGPILKAFERHRKDLKHCWLIASHDSDPYEAPLMRACEKYFPNVVIQPIIKVNDVYAKIDEVYYATHGIFNQCEKQTDGAVTPRTLIADLTGGTKIMSAAVAMACLDVDRKMQYIEQKGQKAFYEIEITYEKVSTRPSASV